MVEFALPKNSRITGGKTWPKPAGATETREFRIYRWNPDDGKNPSTDTYYIDTADCGPMLTVLPPTLMFALPSAVKTCGTDRP